MNKGLLVAKRETLRPGDLMDVYVFEEWSHVPSSKLGGRVALLMWGFNGAKSSAWENELYVDCPDCHELFSDPDNGCDTCTAFTTYRHHR